jgi:hypothetical protein
MTLCVLIHSPLVGPYTWTPVAETLRQRGIETIVPTLTNDSDPIVPFWKQHALAVCKALETVPLDQPLILVAHSGSGPLLPAIREGLVRRIADYLFVDAGLPENGKSRLDLFGDAEGVAQFRENAVNGMIQPWTDDDLRVAIPDDAIRQKFVAEFRPMPLEVYEEKLPVFATWPDAPCGYLQFTSTYDPAAEQAQRAGWPYCRIEAEHFHMLVAPSTVADAMLDLLRSMHAC